MKYKLFAWLSRWRGLIKLALAVAAYFSFWPFFGEKVSALILATLAIHEYGHVLALKLLRVKTSGFYFVPFLGAVTHFDQDPASHRQKLGPNADAFVSLMGPLFGLLATLGLYLWFRAVHQPQMGWATYLAAGLNLFNLVPVKPLDGGRIAAGLLTNRRRLVGFVLVGALMSLLGGFMLVLWGDGGLIFFGLSAWALVAAIRRAEWRIPRPRRVHSGWLYSLYGLTGLATLTLLVVPPFHNSDVLGLITSNGRTHIVSLPTYLNSQPPVVTWRVDVSGLFDSGKPASWENFFPYGPNTTQRIETQTIGTVLSDPSGWRAAGISFQPVSAGSADLTFHIVYPTQMKVVCGSAISWQCPAGSGTVWLSATVLRAALSTPHGQWLLQVVINGALGTMWGLPQERGTVTSHIVNIGQPLPIYPNSEQLGQVKAAIHAYSQSP